MCDWEALYVQAAERSPEQAKMVEYANEMYKRTQEAGDDFNRNPFMVKSNLALFLTFFPNADMKI